MGVHGKTVFDWQRNLEYQDIHFDLVAAYFGSKFDWANFLKKHTSMMRPSAITKDIIRESANILFEYEILDAESQKPAGEYSYFINNAEVRRIHSSAKSIPSQHFEDYDIYVGVFSGTQDDSFVQWIETDIQPRYVKVSRYNSNGTIVWDTTPYDINELLPKLLGASPDAATYIHNKEVRGMKVGDIRYIKVHNHHDTFPVKRVL